MVVKKVVNDKIIAFDFSLDITRSDFLLHLCNKCNFEEVFVEVFTVEKGEVSISERLLAMGFNLVYIPYKGGFQDVAIRMETRNLPTLLSTLSEYIFEDITVWNCNERWEQHLFWMSARRRIDMDNSDLYLRYNQAEKSVELYLSPHYLSKEVERIISAHAR